MKKSTMITGYLAALMLLVGIVFKIQHWPGASILILLACASFSLAYGVQLFLEKLKFLEDFFSKFVAAWVLLLMIALPASFIFKLQHYPGAEAVVSLSQFFLFVSIPILIVYAFKTKEDVKKLNFHHEAILLIILAAFSVFVWNMRISKNVLNSFLPLNETVVKEMNYHESKSNELYTILENAVKTSNAGKSYMAKAMDVKTASDSLCADILEIENLMAIKSGQGKCNFDSLSIIAKDATDVSAFVMIVNGKGEELKQNIVKFKEIVNQSTNSRGKEIMNIFFNTDDPKPAEGEKNGINWVSEKFEHLPLIAVLFELNQMRSNIRLLESETMIYLQAMAAKAINNEVSRTVGKDKK